MRWWIQNTFCLECQYTLAASGSALLSLMAWNVILNSTSWEWISPPALWSLVSWATQSSRSGWVYYCWRGNLSLHVITNHTSCVSRHTLHNYARYLWLSQCGGDVNENKWCVYAKRHLNKAAFKPTWHLHDEYTKITYSGIQIWESFMVEGTRRRLQQCSTHTHRHLWSVVRWSLPGSAGLLTSWSSPSSSPGALHPAGGGDGGHGPGDQHERDRGPGGASKPHGEVRGERHIPDTF